jgi:hypothetical protein
MLQLLAVTVGALAGPSCEGNPIRKRDRPRSERRTTRRPRAKDMLLSCRHDGGLTDPSRPCMGGNGSNILANCRLGETDRGRPRPCEGQNAEHL